LTQPLFHVFYEGIARKLTNQLFELLGGLGRVPVLETGVQEFGLIRGGE